MARPTPIRPQDALCAIFMLNREAGRVSERDLRVCFDVDAAALAGPLAVLRRQGLIADEGLQLTFLGLTAAVSLLPQALWDDGTPKWQRAAA